MPYIKEPIAVVGSGCRFPGGASSPSKLWDLLRDPKDVQRQIDRFRADNFYDQDGHYHGASNVLAAYLLAEDTKKFDAQFFNIPLSEAEAIDPQQRLLLETVYESLEAAGLSMESLSGSNTAAYVGVMCDDFSQIEMLTQDEVYGDSEDIPTYAATGSARSILSNRISYFFNWHGPSMTIDTACSSSLIAVHQAVQVLRSGESPVAIAAGTNLIFGPTMFVAESNLNMLSPTGRSRMWDAGADGYARGEGVASIVMKTLSAALRDGDHIEYIIRETGINQDGKTPGITMPSSDLQASLIRDTYARAGLDPSKRNERCQYFEAHGTGTPAGDPQEARAIYKAFFSHQQQSGAQKTDSANDESDGEQNILLVGSIKTIIGHTEGTAGIAGLMKAGLAIQNRAIPPNMHFTRLNPDLKPYYNNLKVPIHLRDWPETAEGVPRRASVNSFGFGGANAHAIIESYEPELQHPAHSIPSRVNGLEAITSVLKSQVSSPHVFVFSAASSKALTAQLKSYHSFLEENPDFDMDVLFWSLFRRTAHNFRVSFPSKSIRSLSAQIAEALEQAEVKKTPLGDRVRPRAPRQILGVFTGQGAQWATMGRELILSSHFAKSIIEDLERSLAELPRGDVPDWSLMAELIASKEHSRISDSVISQPLCTAVQIMVVELLRQAGISFNAVVGHSSGEIACAYVSGFLSASDAIRVAYYRGKYTPAAKARAGAMIAVGTSMQDAIDMCSLPKLRSRAQLAASNSSASVTISGDADAIKLVEVVAKDESKFARTLKVDTAYHSFHMAVCSDPYLAALQRCGIQVTEPSEDACAWYTSVIATNERVTMNMSSALMGQYWCDNMLEPVLFSQALKAAVSAQGPPGVVLEVGPHPALKGPASLTIEEAVGAVPYFGTLSRGHDDALALVSTLGSIWSVLGASAIPKMRNFQVTFSEHANFFVSKQLPSYDWDHDRVIWNETRVSKAHRLRSSAKHKLLGVREVDEGESERRWRNYLSPKEMPWLRGHQIQGQMVFPAAGFAVMALEAARTLVTSKTVRLMKLQKFSIHKALSFIDENAKVETLFCLSGIQESIPDEEGQSWLSAGFACYACQNKDIGSFVSMASGEVKLSIGSLSEQDGMPERPSRVNNFVDTDVAYFYECLAELGYGYQGMFQGVTDLRRTNGESKGTITIPQDDGEDESILQNWVIHPATLDVAFQAVFAAVGAPGDGRLWALHVPTMIDSITVNPGAYEMSLSGGVATPLPFDAFVVDSDQQDGIAGDVDLYDEDGRRVIVQIQGLHVTPLAKASAADDRDTFASITWSLEQPDLISNWSALPRHENDQQVARFSERLSLCILRDLCDVAAEVDVERDGTSHQRAIVDWAQYVLRATRSREHPTCLNEWLADSWDVLEVHAQRLAKSNAQIQRCLAARGYLTSLLRNQLSPEEEVDVSRLSDDFYGTIPGYREYLDRLAGLTNQLAFKHRNMRVLEIGAGEGYCTKAILDVLGQNFTSYTCTDVDTAHFDSLKSQIPAAQAERIEFKALDLEQSPAEQGFTAGHYDLVVASNSLHTTADLEETLRQIRTLVRPGGYLALLEPTSNSSLAVALGGCASPAWFSGIEENRRYSPFVTQEEWDDVLRTAGFSGLDTATPEEPDFATPYSVMCSMAVDKQMDILRDPLSHASQIVSDVSLLIIGGRTVHTRNLVRDLKRTLAPLFREVRQAEGITDVDDETLAIKPVTICLAELDELLFKPFTEDKFNAIVKICDSLQTMLWITIGSRGENPYMNMMVAVGRCLVGEMPNLRLQFLNFDGSDRPTANIVAHHLLRLHHSSNLTGEPRKPHEPLYLIERELTVQNGTLLLPRYLPVAPINARLNSDKRVITHEVDQSQTAVAVDATTSHYRLRDAPPSIHTPDDVRISVSKSLFHAIRIASDGTVGCLHLILGSTGDGSKKIITLSEANQSIVWVPRSRLVELEPLDLPDHREEDVLNSTAAELLAMSILAGAWGAVLVHEPSPVLARSLVSLSRPHAINLVMTSTSSDAAIGGVKRIHPACPDRDLVRIVPKETSVFIDLSEAHANASTPNDAIGSRLENLVPRGCKVKRTSHLCSVTAFGFATNHDDRDAASALKSAVQHALKSNQLDSIKLSQHQRSPIVPASAVSSLAQLRSVPYLQAIDWRVDATLPVTIRPVDESIRFRNDRTYFLVGLAGELGLQLTKWMVKHGAKYLALASRNPQLNPDWLELVQSEGAVVKSYAMDVTSRSSVRTAHKRICAEMPPVAGVMNGAMILIDGLFANKTHAEFEKTLRPKVEGTVFLDEIFSSKDLDFFIAFSSLACVSGNMGQTAYAAANAFMCSLVAGRRMRGLAGSAINMPGIVGLGYLNRDTRKLDRLKNLGYVNISEWDFYQFLSEAIAAGRPDSGMNPEITAGLKKLQIEGDLDDLPLWSKTPRFHWLRIPASSTVFGTADGDSKNAGSSVRSRLAEVTGEDELRTLLLDGLLATLYARLNMNPDEQGITPGTAIVELGVDSLLAVDMRSWFTKELGLDMPVLKILGGATVHDLIDDAIKRLAPELVPKLAGSAAVADSAVDTDVQQQKPGDVEVVPFDGNADLGVDDTDGDVPPEEEEEAVEPEAITMAPIDLPPYDDEDSASETNGPPAGVESRKYHSTDVEDLEETDRQSDTTQPTSQSDSASSDYIKVELEPKFVDAQGGSRASDEDQQPTAKLFSQFHDDANQKMDFVKKVSMSYGTARFWFLMQYLRDPTTFNLLCHVKFTGYIRFDDADRCIEALGNRHEVFRTCFYADPGRFDEPTMGVMEKSHLRLERRFAKSEGDVDAEGAELLNYDFKIEQGETIRVKMISLPDSTHHLLFGFHHIVLDGFSFSLLLAELNPLYDGQTLEPIKTTFSDFAVRQRQQVMDGSMDGDFQYWKDVYSAKLPSGEVKPDFPEPLPLFNLAQAPRRSMDVYESHESSLVLDARTSRQIKAQCRRHKITPFHFFLGVLRTFLGRHLGVDDLVIGVADANRVDASLDSTAGFMLNLLPLRFRNAVEGSKQELRFKDVAQTARDTVYGALAHSRLPFDALLERLDIPRSATHSPLFQVWMDYRPIKPGNRPTLFGSEANGTQTVGRNGYDLTLDITELDDSEPRISFRTQKYLYSAESTQKLFESYMRLVRAFAAKFDAPVESVPLWNPNDIEVAKTLGRGPEQQSEWPETVSHRIAKIASQNPSGVAVKDDNGSFLLYEQLQRRTQRISNALVSAGVREGSRVAVFQEPTADWVCSLLAIWHAGATYIPLDIRSSESLSRLAIIARAAKLSAILCHDQTEAKVPELQSSASVINVSLLSEDDNSGLTETKARSTTAAAVLFTSGSTGVPKGVVLPHRAFRNTIEGLTRQYSIGAEKVLQQSAFSFDFSLDQILCGLANGGTVYVVSKENRGDPSAIAKIVETEGITYTRATPSEYTSWLAYGGDSLRRADGWKFAWAGGEVLPRSVVQSLGRLALPALKLYNSYGPAETITCTKTEIPFERDDFTDGDDDDGDDHEGQEVIPVGFPLPNYSVFIVDHNLELVPQGAAGEIVISGPSVGTGYLNDEKLSESKFIGNAYATSDKAGGSSRIVYCTGDLGRLRGDGSLLFLGRMAGATMVKLRGMRIDLQEIENSILTAAEGALQKAVVSLRGDHLLVAHVQFSGDDEQYADSAVQKAFLRQLRFILPLPLYMVPAIFVPLLEMPTNAHGKTDRRAIAELALPQAANNSGRSSEDLSETERKLLQIWKEVVRAEAGGEDVTSAIQVTDQTSFFELGGNSLLLVKLQMLIGMRFNAKLSLLDLFGAASLGAMATKIEAAPAADLIDWEQETHLQRADFEDSFQANAIPTAASRDQCRPLSVMVTGATGFLGRKLVDALTASDRIGEIHSVAARSATNSKSRKLKTYTGDLASPRLGLSKADFAALSATVDVIVHAGVARSLVDSYQLLRGANFESTKALVRLAARRRIPIHFISSGSVSTLEEKGATPPTSGSNGYAASKWASERYLGHAAAMLGLPVTLHRIAQPLQHEIEDEDFEDASREVVEHVRALSAQMGIAPAAADVSLLGPNVAIDLIRVDDLAEKLTDQLIGEILSQKEENGRGQVRRIRHPTEARVSLSDIVLADTGLPTLPAMQWIARARREGFAWQIASMDRFPLGLE
ncbi:hypothetical protein DL764_009059 [Monosporascus ibericus]|uniref:Carrier domain-containing protein n=1 Tax=Monosporascus ibericus TaxID=155417 RepID=A0A4Q4SYP7_9PEZI|nr:hypothetical protein DL764_009059 [Monosporascus ibericus]